MNLKFHLIVHKTTWQKLVIENSYLSNKACSRNHHYNPVHGRRSPVTLLQCSNCPKSTGYALTVLKNFFESKISCGLFTCTTLICTFEKISQQSREHYLLTNMEKLKLCQSGRPGATGPQELVPQYTQYQFSTWFRRVQGTLAWVKRRIFSNVHVLTFGFRTRFDGLVEIKWTRIL